MLIDCHVCKAKVDAELLCEHNDLEFMATKTFLLKCPSCNSAIVALSAEDFLDEKPIWTKPSRVYPRPKRELGPDVPPIVRKSLEEAERCMQSGAYLAATAMCGRSLEAICRHHKTKDGYLAGGLKELRDSGVIEARLYKWGEELRDQRNNAAHATDVEIGAQDANDVMTFTYAIVDYVFLLAQKFEQFQQRKAKRAIKETKDATAAPKT
jgi:Domain of unknown function (DUF4145)